MADTVTGNIRTYYAWHGSGYPLVFVHEALLDHGKWQAQIEPFAGKYDLIADDLRAHGRSGKAGSPKYSVELLRQDLLELLNNLEISCAHLCGLGLGGLVVQEFAARYPLRVKKIFLCNTHVSTASDRMLAPMVRLLGAARFVNISIGLAKLIRGKNWLGKTGQIRDYVETCRCAFETRELALIYEMFMSYRGAELSRIPASSPILSGENKALSMLWHADFLRKQINHAQAHILPGADHLANLENPRVFNSLILDFLA